MQGAPTTRWFPIVEEAQRRRCRHLAAILRTDGQLRPIPASDLVDDDSCIASSFLLGLARKSHPRKTTHL